MPVHSLDQLTTEATNRRSAELDTMPVLDLLTLMNAEDAGVPLAVRAALPAIAAAVELIITARHRGGRLVYFGAGTSGRLGVLDAVECPPTFGTDPGEVIGVMAGGPGALFAAVEGAEDDAALGAADLAALNLTDADVVVGLAASGRTPYVIGGLDQARAMGAGAIAIACNPGAEISRHADVAIEVDAGPEVLTGSTRLKAATAQKLVCNMLSTASMVRTGKAYGNLMVDVRPTNAKLVDRARRIVIAATGADPHAAESALDAARGHAKTAIVMILADCGPAEAGRRLREARGFVRVAITAR
jgi:N-acetylmuramic acid 6-phosphate etherase